MAENPWRTLEEGKGVTGYPPVDKKYKNKQSLKLGENSG